MITAGIVSASLLGAILLNIVGLFGIQFENYFIIYLYFILSIFHAIVNLIISCLFYHPLFINLIVELFISIVVYFYLKTIKKKHYSESIQNDVIESTI